MLKVIGAGPQTIKYDNIVSFRNLVLKGHNVGFVMCAEDKTEYAVHDPKFFDKAGSQKTPFVLLKYADSSYGYADKKLFEAMTPSLNREVSEHG